VKTKTDLLQRYGLDIVGAGSAVGGRIRRIIETMSFKPAVKEWGSYRWISGPRRCWHFVYPSLAKGLPVLWPCMHRYTVRAVRQSFYAKQNQ